MLLIGHNLHCNCGLHVIGVFNLFEHCISLEIPIFDSCVGLERLHLFDQYFTCTLALGFVSRGGHFHRLPRTYRVPTVGRP
jgi:hypothetical protein